MLAVDGDFHHMMGWYEVLIFPYIFITLGDGIVCAYVYGCIFLLFVIRGVSFDSVSFGSVFWLKMDSRLVLL